jgi:hypothetical protein
MEPGAAAELAPIDERLSGRRALVALVVVVIAFAFTCAALMIIDWTPPPSRAPPAPASKPAASASASARFAALSPPLLLG